MKNILCFASILIICIGCKNTSIAIKPETTKQEKQLLKVNKSHATIVIDGKADDTIWTTQNWHPLDQLW